MPGGCVAAGGQQRQVQFVIERDCPQSRRKTAVKPPWLIDECIWVEWPPQEAWDRSSWPCELPLRFRVTDASFAECVRKLGKNPRQSYAYVCEHMGRIIE